MRLLPEPFFVSLGMLPEDYDEARDNLPLGEGIEVSKAPYWHSHPALGIIGHGHGVPEDPQSPHVHKAEIHWGDVVPIDSGGEVAHDH